MLCNMFCFVFYVKLLLADILLLDFLTSNLFWPQRSSIGQSIVLYVHHSKLYMSYDNVI